MQPYFKQRINQNMEYLIDLISMTIMNTNQKTFMFFDFVEDLIRECCNDFTQDNLQNLLNALRDRVLADFKLLQEKLKGGKTLNLSTK